MAVLFVDGPADGQTFELDPCPFYVRVAIEPWVGACGVLTGRQEPYDGEDVAVYVRPGEVLRIAGQSPTASYVWLPDVDGDLVRRPEAWRVWATNQPAAGKLRVGDTTWPLPTAAS